MFLIPDFLLSFVVYSWLGFVGRTDSNLAASR